MRRVDKESRAEAQESASTPHPVEEGDYSAVYDLSRIARLRDLSSTQMN